MDKGHWDTFWQQNRTLNSFSEGEFTEGYQGELVSFWREAGRSCLQQGGQVIDLACGNGGLALAIQRIAAESTVSVQLHAVDAANVNPTRTFAHDAKLTEELASIHFHPSTPLERLPFSDGSTQFCVSQFGLEYANLQQAVSECARVLTSNGHLIAMMHHPDSSISQDTRNGLHIIRLIRDQSPVFPHAAMAFDLSEPQQDPALFSTASKSLFWILDSIRQQAIGMDAETWFLDIVSKIAVMMQRPSAARVTELQALHHELSLLEQRLEDQLNAALSPERCELLHSALNANGMDCQLEPFYLQNELFGLVLKSKKK